MKVKKHKPKFEFRTLTITEKDCISCAFLALKKDCLFGFPATDLTKTNAPCRVFARTNDERVPPKALQKVKNFLQNTATYFNLPILL